MNLIKIKTHSSLTSKPTHHQSEIRACYDRSPPALPQNMRTSSYSSRGLICARGPTDRCKFDARFTVDTQQRTLFRVDKVPTVRTSAVARIYSPLFSSYLNGQI
ncbi:hypothetical protein Mapa_001025 [Marchantia paleacea]|nr:hypothetical protein Mapa_001025 [Marchantia paleacea]